jgi:hypothetical protein
LLPGVVDRAIRIRAHLVLCRAVDYAQCPMETANRFSCYRV